MLFHTIRLAKMQSLTGSSFVRVWSDGTSYPRCWKLATISWRYMYTIVQKDTMRWLPKWLSVKNLPAIQEMKFQCMVQENPLEKETATHSNILAWEILWTVEPVGQQSMGKTSLDKYPRLINIYTYIHTYMQACTYTCMLEDMKNDNHRSIYNSKILATVQCPCRGEINCVISIMEFT